MGGQIYISMLKLPFVWNVMSYHRGGEGKDHQAAGTLQVRGRQVNFALFVLLGAGTAFRGRMKSWPTGQVPVGTTGCTGEDSGEGHCLAERAGDDKNASP